MAEPGGLPTLVTQPEYSGTMGGGWNRVEEGEATQVWVAALAGPHSGPSP